jgi:hypothetical protein
VSASPDSVVSVPVDEKRPPPENFDAHHLAGVCGTQNPAVNRANTSGLVTPYRF